MTSTLITDLYTHFFHIVNFPGYDLWLCGIGYQNYAMIKCISCLFFIFILSTSFGQNGIIIQKQNKRSHRSGIPESLLKEAAASKVPISMTRNVRRAKNGDILIASYVGVYRYDGISFTNMTRTIEWPTFWDVLEDRKGNIWTTGAITGQAWALSRYDAETLYNENPTITEIMSQGPALLGLVEGADGSIWFGSMTGVHRYDGNTITDFKSNVVQK